jgi:hypothetical protein
MHQLVRNLYKEAIYVGRDYPLGLEKVRTEWKKALRNPKNCPSCYDSIHLPTVDGDTITCDSDASSDPAAGAVVATPKKMHSKEFPNPNCERELRKAVGKGRYMIREMIGVIQLKKYRSLKRRYGDSDDDYVAMFHKKLAELQKEGDEPLSETRDDQKENDA